MDRIHDIAEYMFNVILSENPGFKSLAYRLPETLEHLKKGTSEFASNYMQDKYPIEIFPGEWNELSTIMVDNIQYKGDVSQGTALMVIDKETSVFLHDEKLDEILDDGDFVVSQVLGNFVRIKNKLTNRVTQYYYLADRFLFATKEKKMDLDLDKVKHKFVPGVKTFMNFASGDKCYSVLTGEEFEVIGAFQNQLNIKSPSGTMIFASPLMYRSSPDQISVKNKYNEEINLNDLVEVRALEIHKVMKGADWDDIKDPDYHIWANVLKANKAKVVDIQGKNVIVNFIGEKLGDFKNFDFRIFVDNLVAKPSNVAVFPKADDADKWLKEKEEEEEMDKEDLTKGPYDLSEYLNKIVKIVDFNVKIDNEPAHVWKIDNEKGRLHLRYENNSKCTFRISKGKEHLVVVGNLFDSNL